eukprot:COSAG04_NODE_805_length_10154_cov_9.105122_13_plen_88_part_00
MRRLSDGRGEALEGSGDGFDRVARRVHIDQDMDGDPLRERGLVWLFKLPGTPPRTSGACWIILLDNRVTRHSLRQDEFSGPENSFTP